MLRIILENTGVYPVWNFGGDLILISFCEFVEGIKSTNIIMAIRDSLYSRNTRGEYQGIPHVSHITHETTIGGKRYAQTQNT